MVTLQSSLAAHTYRPGFSLTEYVKPSAIKPTPCSCIIHREQVERVSLAAIQSENGDLRRDFERLLAAAVGQHEEAAEEAVSAAQAEAEAAEARVR